MESASRAGSKAVQGSIPSVDHSTRYPVIGERAGSSAGAVQDSAMASGPSTAAVRLDGASGATGSVVGETNPRAKRENASTSAHTSLPRSVESGRGCHSLPSWR